MTTIKVVVFDLDDTLFPEREFVRSGFQAVGNWILHKYSVVDFFEVAWQLFLEGKRGKIFNLALEKLGFEYEPSMIQELLQVYREHKPDIALHKDAKWAINNFKKDRKLGLITDGYLITQKNKVEALAIESNFDVIVYSDLYGRDSWKPSPVTYLRVMEATKSQGENCIYVGDNPHKDFVTAKKLGWTTFQICREVGEYSDVISEDSYQANFKIKSLLELKTMV